MMNGRAMVLVAAALLASTCAYAHEGKMKPLERHARDMSDPLLYSNEYYPDGYYYPPVDQNDLSFLGPNEDYPSDDMDYEGHRSAHLLQQYPVNVPDKTRSAALEKVLLDFMEDNREPSNDGIKKRVLSSFRERMENEKNKEQHEKMAEMFLRKMEKESEERDAERDYESSRDYMEMLEELWEKYKSSHPEMYMAEENPHVYMTEEIRKRQMPSDYAVLGWSGVGYRKRAYPLDVDVPNDALEYISYSPQQDVYSRLRSEEDEKSNPDRYEYLRTNQDPYRQRMRNHNRGRNQEFIYAKRKRFPVAKRSSNFYGANGHRKLYNKEQKAKKNGASGTDPKIVKDLSNIFGTKELKKQNMSADGKPKKFLKKTEKNTKTTQKATVTEAPGKETTLHPTTPVQQEQHHHSVNEPKTKPAQEQPKSKFKDEPLNIKKKSIDWSNYFGIDRRRKKSEFNSNNNIDNEWLMERYHKAVAMATKRSTEYPLNFFRNHEGHDNEKPEEFERKSKSDSSNAEETKLGEMDVKLKNIEDLIIDEALKYTGAHEGATDSKEVQEVKDKVISRLAAAYSLEKMRRALSEFKTSIAAQRYAMKSKEANKEPASEDKDIAVDKKDDGPVKEDKKCVNCEQQTEVEYPAKLNNEFETNMYPAEPRNGPSGNMECNTIERRCRNALTAEHGNLFYSLCKWHQMCYICSPDNSQESITSCDVMFLTKADLLCQEDFVCQWSARPAVEYLRSLFESSPVELVEQCGRSICEPEGPGDGPPADGVANHLVYNIR